VSGELTHCKHCDREFVPGSVARKPRGLCTRCYKRPEVVAKYPPLPGSYYGVTVEGDGRSPKVPTHHLPGTPGKIEVMRQRAERGETLFHPLDGQAVFTPGEDE